MGVIVAFDYAAWIAAYPEFANVPEPTALAYFNQATLYQANDGGGPPITVAAQALTLLNMLTAHIASINAPPDQGGSGSTLVGRVSSASEGSVSVQTDFGDAKSSSPSAAWFNQTKYGAAWWQATAPFRTFRHRPAWAGNRSPYGGRGLGYGYGGWPWPR